MSSRVAVSKLRVSNSGLTFIGAWEGYRRWPYNDAAGHATVGYGHLLHFGPVTRWDRVRWRLGLSPSSALKLLRSDAARAEQAVHRGVHVPLRQCEYDALVSFAFNCGPAAIAASSAVRELNHGRYVSVPQLLLAWDHAGTRVLPGLFRRRVSEGRVFAHADYRIR